MSISYLELFIWIKNCINRLPFPKSLKSLTINATNSHLVDDHSEALYPTGSEYDEISRFLYRLYQQGGLETITLSITKDVDSTASDAELHMDEVRETVKLETSFAALLEENVLDVEFLLQRYNDDGMPEPIMHCSVERKRRQIKYSGCITAHSMVYSASAHRPSYGHARCLPVSQRILSKLTSALIGRIHLAVKKHSGRDIFVDVITLLTLRNISSPRCWLTEGVHQWFTIQIALYISQVRAPAKGLRPRESTRKSNIPIALHGQQICPGF
ncbi:hypothetical protein EYR38_005019 [Pleurotus pulmonarius]|nr:hypothetical protein EYR38_005019 [Pleurotus pulmonarius]